MAYTAGCMGASIISELKIRFELGGMRGVYTKIDAKADAGCIPARKTGTRTSQYTINHTITNTN